VKSFLRVYHEDLGLYKKYGSRARLYLERLHISNNLMQCEDFSHDWLVEFQWHDLDREHSLMDGLRALKHQYDYLKREKVVSDNGIEILSNKP
jgi:hypothetical protein